MMPKMIILICFLCCGFFMIDHGRPEHRPLKSVEGWNFAQISSQQLAFTLTDDSTFIEYMVVKLTDEEDLPMAYMSDIMTPVCDDTLCALMNIRIYWNLVGNYVGMDTLAGKPLTKNDHIKFSEEDYEKLHHLLMDENSIIKRKEKKELFDQEQTRVSEVVDAVTGATAKEVKEAVVDGALYSCYTLYHIVHGPLSDSIQQDMDRHFDSRVQDKLLESHFADYQLYVLKKMADTAFIRYQDQVMEIFKKAIPLNRIYIMKKMPFEMWTDEQVQVAISSYYNDMDVNSQSFMLRKMAEINNLDHQCLLHLSQNVISMSRNQLKSYIRMLSHNKERLTPEILQEISHALESGKQYYGYLMEEFLASNNLIPKDQK